MLFIQNSHANERSVSSSKDPLYYIELANQFESTDVDYANSSLVKALKLLENNPNIKLKFTIIIKQASIAKNEQDYRKSQHYLEKAKSLRDMVSQKLLKARASEHDDSLDFNLLLADIRLFQLEAELMYSQKRFAKALNFLDEAIARVEATGNNASLLYRLFNMKGVVYLKAKQYQSALTSFLLSKHHAHTQSNSVKIRLYSDIAFSYTRINDNYSAIKYFKNTLRLLESNPPAPKKVEAVLESDEVFPSKERVLLDISRSYKKAGAFRDALSFGNKALTVAKKTNNEEFTLKSLVHLSSIYRRLSSYESALEFAVEALQIYQKNNDLSGMASSYNAIGLIYNRLGEKGKAKIYFNKVISLPQSKIQPKYYAAALRELALYHLYKNDYSDALAINEQAYRIYEQLNNLKGIATVKKNEGLIYQAMGNTDLALKAFTFGYETSKQTGDAWEQASNMIKIALLYAEIQPNKTQLWAGKGLRIAQRIQAKPVIEQAYLALAIAEETMKNYKQALIYTKLQAHTLDAIKNDTINMHTNEMHALQSVMNKMYQTDILKEKMAELSDKYFKQNAMISELKNQVDNDDTVKQNLQFIIAILLIFILFFIAKLNKLTRV